MSAAALLCRYCNGVVEGVSAGAYVGLYRCNGCGELWFTAEHLRAGCRSVRRMVAANKAQAARALNRYVERHLRTASIHTPTVGADQKKEHFE